MTSDEYKEQLSAALGKLAGVHAVGDSWITFDGSIPAGGVPFTGQLVTRAMYADLWEWVQANKTVVDDATWQSTASAQNGMCASYSSGDGSTTFRLPCVVGGYLCAGDTSTAGGYVKEGLPNITGGISNVVTGYTSAGTDGSGAMQASSSATVAGLSTGAGRQIKNVNFDASRSNPIYGNSSHVTPETFKVLVGVYAFGVAGTIGEATEAGIVEELEHKADLDASNFSTAGKNVLAGMGMPSGRHVDLTLGASGTTYTAPAAGYIAYAGGCSVAGRIHLAGDRVQDSRYAVINEWNAAAIPVKKGDVTTFYYNGTLSLGFFRFIYAEGAS